MNEITTGRDRKTVESEFTRCYLMSKLAFLTGIILNGILCTATILSITQKEYLCMFFCLAMTVIHFLVFASAYTSSERDVAALAKELDSFTEESD